MAFRLGKRVSCATDAGTLTGKRGASVSGGPKGAKLSTNTRGEKRAWAGLFGAFWRKKL